MQKNKPVLFRSDLLQKNVLLLARNNLVHVRACSGFMWAAMQLFDVALGQTAPACVRTLDQLALTPGFVLAWWHMRTSAVIAERACEVWSELLARYGGPGTTNELLAEMQVSPGEPLLVVVPCGVTKPEELLRGRAFCTSCVPHAA